MVQEQQQKELLRLLSKELKVDVSLRPLLHTNALLSGNKIAG
jgi:hypothetical protein